MNKVIIIIKVLLILVSESTTELVSLTIEDGKSDGLKLCAIYKGPSANQLTSDRKPQVIDVTMFDACNLSTIISPEKFDSKAALIKFKKSTKCNLSVIARNFQATNVSFVIAKSILKHNLSTLNSSIPFLFLSDKIYPSDIEYFLDEYENSENEASIKRFDYPFDFSILVTISIAFSTVLIGATWNRKKFLNDIKKDATIETAEVKSPVKLKDKMNNLKFGYFSILMILLVFVLLTLNLIFYENVGSWIIFALFVVSSLSSLWRACYKLMGKIPFLKYELPIKALKNPPQLRIFISKVFGIIIVLIWSLNRAEDWTWIIQDVMVVSIALNILSYGIFKSYRFVLLSSILFVFYDVFMVFILPIILKGDYKLKTSVGFGLKASYDSKFEQVENVINFDPLKPTENNQFVGPFYLIIPNILNIKKICNQYYNYPYTIMGIGEIIIPGLSLNYAILFDTSNNASNNKYYYLLINLAGYIIGYIIVGLLVSLLNLTQPVILYVSSILALSNLVSSRLKNEFHNFWYGIAIQKYMFNEQN